MVPLIHNGSEITTWMGYSFKIKSINKLFFQMSAQVYSVPRQTEGRRKTFLEWTSIDLSSELSLTCGGNVNYYKSVHHTIPNLPVGIGNTLTSSSFNWVSSYILFLRRRGRPFWRVKEGGRIVRLSLRALGCHKRWKSLSFCEIWNNTTAPFSLLIRRPYK